MLLPRDASLWYLCSLSPGFCFVGAQRAAELLLCASGGVQSALPVPTW